MNTNLSTYQRFPPTIAGMRHFHQDPNSEAQHTHPRQPTPTLEQVLACPVCNAASYARHNSTHRKAA